MQLTSRRALKIYSKYEGASWLLIVWPLQQNHFISTPKILEKFSHTTRRTLPCKYDVYGGGVKRIRAFGRAVKDRESSTENGVHLQNTVRKINVLEDM
jgi:hypothetical protein